MESFSIDRLNELASVKDNAEAWYELGCRYRDGVDVARNKEKSLSSFLAAAKLGHPGGQYSLGMLEQDAEKNNGEYVNWFNKAARQGHAPAQLKMGNHSRIAGRASDAFRWFSAAAKNGHLGAQCNLGHCFRKGLGVERDLAKAEYWYRSGMRRGSGPCGYELARLLETGSAQSGTKGLVEAARMYIFAANRGVVEAENYLPAFEANHPSEMSLARKDPLCQDAATEGVDLREASVREYMNFLKPEMLKGSLSLATQRQFENIRRDRQLTLDDHWEAVERIGFERSEYEAMADTGSNSSPLPTLRTAEIVGLIPVGSSSLEELLDGIASWNLQNALPPGEHLLIDEALQNSARKILLSAQCWFSHFKLRATISCQQFHVFIQSYLKEITQFWSSTDQDSVPAIAWKIVDLFDDDGNGEIDLSEFVTRLCGRDFRRFLAEQFRRLKADLNSVDITSSLPASVDNLLFVFEADLYKLHGTGWKNAGLTSKFEIHRFRKTAIIVESGSGTPVSAIRYSTLSKGKEDFVIWADENELRTFGLLFESSHDLASWMKRMKRLSELFVKGPEFNSHNSRSLTKFKSRRRDSDASASAIDDQTDEDLTSFAVLSIEDVPFQYYFENRGRNDAEKRLQQMDPGSFIVRWVASDDVDDFGGNRNIVMISYAKPTDDGFASTLQHQAVLYDRSQGWALLSTGASELSRSSGWLPNFDVVLNLLAVSFGSTANQIQTENDYWYFDQKYLQEQGRWEIVKSMKWEPSFRKRWIVRDCATLDETGWSHLQRIINYLDGPHEMFNFSEFVKNAYCVHNENLRNGFYRYYAKHATRKAFPGSAFKKWCTDTDEGLKDSDEWRIWRQQVLDDAHQKADDFRLQYQAEPHICQAVAVHGTSAETARLIAASGLNKLYRPKKNKDWFGTGVYLTDSLLYSLLYSCLASRRAARAKNSSSDAESTSTGTATTTHSVVICLAQWTEAFPCVENPCIDDEKNQALLQNSLKDGFDMHYVKVNPSIVGKNQETGKPVKRWVPQRVVDEGVISVSEFCFDRQEEGMQQVLPMYVVEFEVSEALSNRLLGIKHHGATINESQSPSASSSKLPQISALKLPPKASTGRRKSIMLGNVSGALGPEEGKKMFEALRAQFSPRQGV